VSWTHVIETALPFANRIVTFGEKFSMTMDNYAKTSGMETPVMNQAAIMGILKVEFSRARRYACPLSCALIQIDRYMYLRDMYGVEIAEGIEEQVVKQVTDNTRLSDYLGRMQDRFLLLMPHTDASGALTTVKRIQSKLSSLDIELSGKIIQVTLSIGIADNGEEESIFYDSILKRSETSLKKVIDRGGDGFEIFTSEE
jgi:diguanylate cyclase (GGDEF)-like protein